MAKKTKTESKKTSVFDTLKKKFGDTSIQTSDSEDIPDIEVVKTPSISLNRALGVGGLPYGRVVEIYGGFSSGKTTLCLHAIAEAQKRGEVCAYLDAEHAFSKQYAKTLGVDLDKLWLAQPEYGEQALEMANQMARSTEVDVIVVDSVAALTPKVELDGEIGDQRVGVQARMMSQALRMITGNIAKNRILMIFINQQRANIGGYGGKATPGGEALKYYSSIRLDVRRMGKIAGAGDEVLGDKTLVKVTKNKLGPPFREAAFTIRFGQGIDKNEELIQLGVDTKIIAKGGAWLTYGEHKWCGKENACQALMAAPDIAEALEKDVVAALDSGVKPSKADAKKQSSTSEEAVAALLEGGGE